MNRLASGAFFTAPFVAIRFVVFLVILAGAAAVAATIWFPKTVGADWTWCEDYVYAYSTYVVACQPGRNCQVGMGIFAFGQPRGEKIGLSGQREITVIGIGSLHMRSTDGRDPVKVAFMQRTAEPIKTPPIQW